ncbi:sulfite exporter TauE/SafE family protein [Catenulispora rubra]|uniref:sulfite exporter TauE/SafE family protein n=1 Tax=Catenulispora rubra TaxID=280293 RepID=UPI002B278E92|nr:sulfite exporter TauE/SafE family protein [Catenulispora rubra]
MGIGEVAALLGVGMAAGTINTVVGSGTLVTFPTLLAFGYTPVVANVTNTVGLVPGSLSGIHGYRAEIAEFRALGGRRLTRLVLASMLGAALGALLLFLLPAKAFKAIVPALIALALVLIIVQPRLAKRIAARRAARESATVADGAAQGWGVLLAVFGSGMYGGYFGAAQGVLLMAILGLTYSDRLQVLNGVKNVLACVVNAIAAVVFIAVGALGLGGSQHPSVRWGAALAIAVGALVGGQIGASVGRRLPPKVLRGLIVVVGLVAIGSMVL